MQCSEFEIRLVDYQDGTLDPADRRAVEQHASECRLCATLLADSAALAGFLEKVEAVEAPQELVTNILYRTLHTRPAWGAGAGWRSWLGPLLQPRFAMSMAMTVLSVSMLYRVAGVHVRQLEVADLNPVSIWRGVDYRTRRIWDRSVKFYQNIRFIYELIGKYRAVDTEEEQAREAERPGSEKIRNPQPGGPQTQPQPRKLEPSGPGARSIPGKKTG